MKNLMILTFLVFSFGAFSAEFEAELVLDTDYASLVCFNDTQEFEVELFDSEVKAIEVGAKPSEICGALAVNEGTGSGGG